MNKLKVGLTASLTKAFSAADVEIFANLSLDKNRIHLDERYAQYSLFHKRIVHGFLSGSLISAVIGTVLPGEGTIYLHQDMDFRKPVYLDEQITAVVTVEKVDEEKHICQLDTKCINDLGDVKIEGKAIVKY